MTTKLLTLKNSYNWYEIINHKFFALFVNSNAFLTTYHSSLLASTPSCSFLIHHIRHIWFDLLVFHDGSLIFYLGFAHSQYVNHFLLVTICGVMFSKSQTFLSISEALVDCFPFNALRLGYSPTYRLLPITMSHFLLQTSLTSAVEIASDIFNGFIDIDISSQLRFLGAPYSKDWRGIDSKSLHSLWDERMFSCDAPITITSILTTVLTYFFASKVIHTFLRHFMEYSVLLI